MRIRTWFGIAVAVLVGTASLVMAEPGAHRIGVGANYWMAVEDVDVDDVDDNGLAYLATYQYRPDLLGFGIDVELLPDLFGEDAYAPQAYLILGKGLYAAAGIGILNVDDEWADDPFYSVRLGLELDLFDSLIFDLYGNYRFNETSHVGDALEEIDTDTVFLGAAVRIGL